MRSLLLIVMIICASAMSYGEDAENPMWSPCRSMSTPIAVEWGHYDYPNPSGIVIYCQDKDSFYFDEIFGILFQNKIYGFYDGEIIVVTNFKKNKDTRLTKDDYYIFRGDEKRDDLQIVGLRIKRSKHRYVVFDEQKRKLTKFYYHVTFLFRKGQEYIVKSSTLKGTLVHLKNGGFFKIKGKEGIEENYHIQIPSIDLDAPVQVYLGNEITFKKEEPSKDKK
ncbi:MAG: hypothetical protein HY602_00405 [Parcubacteria group bacterium]|nr:hypothetical protein [Parcubacteria group bacterium]